MVCNVLINCVRDIMITEEEIIETIQNYPEHVAYSISNAEIYGATVLYFYRNKNKELFCTAHIELAYLKCEYVSMPVTTVKTLLLLIN